MIDALGCLLASNADEAPSERYMDNEIPGAADCWQGT